MDLPEILLTGLDFLSFLVFLEFLDSWAWDSKNLEKKKKNNPEWTYPRFFSQDCFFCFDIDLGILAMEKNKEEKHVKKQNVQKPNAPSIGFCMRVAENPCYFLHG